MGLIETLAGKPGDTVDRLLYCGGSLDFVTPARALLGLLFGEKEIIYRDPNLSMTDHLKSCGIRLIARHTDLDEISIANISPADYARLFDPQETSSCHWLTVNFRDEEDVSDYELKSEAGLPYFDAASAKAGFELAKAEPMAIHVELYDPNSRIISWLRQYDIGITSIQCNPDNDYITISMPPEVFAYWSECYSLAFAPEIGISKDTTSLFWLEADDADYLIEQTIYNCGISPFAVQRINGEHILVTLTPETYDLLAQQLDIQCLVEQV